MKLRYITAVLACGLLATGCVDHRNDNLSAPKIYLSQGDLEGTYNVVLYDVDDFSEFDFSVFCSGYYPSDVNVNVNVTPSALDDFNESAGMSYQILPEDCYTMSVSKVFIKKEDRFALFSVTFDVDKIEALTNPQDHILPIAISTSDDIEINENKSTIFLRPDIVTPKIKLSNSGVNDIRFDARGGIKEYTVVLECETANKWETDLEIITGAVAIADFNSDLHRNLLPLDDDIVTITFPTELPVGTSSAEVKITVDTDRIPEKSILSTGFRLKSSNIFEVDETRNYYFVRFESNIGPGDVQFLNRSSWTITANSWHNASNRPENLIDGNVASLWQARYSGTAGPNSPGSTFLPFNIDVDMGENIKLSATAVHRREHATYAKDCKAGHIELSKDNVTWVRVADFDYLDSSDYGPLYHFFEEYECRYFRIVITEVSRGSASSDPCSLAEVYSLSLK